MSGSKCCLLVVTALTRRVVSITSSLPRAISHAVAFVMSSVSSAPTTGTASLEIAACGTKGSVTILAIATEPLLMTPTRVFVTLNCAASGR